MLRDFITDLKKKKNHLEKICILGYSFTAHHQKKCSQ